MEHGLGVQRVATEDTTITVLILVLMEHGLGGLKVLLQT